jgi:uncharacterized protein YjbJ (UPF0337 family)
MHEMKAINWFIAGVSVGVAAYIIANLPAPAYATTGDDDIEYAAGRASVWGSKQRLTGAGRGIAGKVKEGIGRVTGDDELAGEGVVDQVAGEVKDTAGKVAQAVGETIHNMNQQQY